MFCDASHKPRRGDRVATRPSVIKPLRFRIKGDMTMRCEQQHNRAWRKNAESIQKSTSAKTSLPLGEARKHLQSSNSSIFFREMQFAPKTSGQWFWDILMYLSLILTAGFLMYSLWAQRPTATEIYDQIGKLVSEKFHSELRNNPEFRQVIRGAL